MHIYVIKTYKFTYKHKLQYLLDEVIYTRIFCINYYQVYLFELKNQSELDKSFHLWPLLSCCLITVSIYIYESRIFIMWD